MVVDFSQLRDSAELRDSELPRPSPARRSWVAIQVAIWAGEVKPSVIAGWRPGQGRRAGRIGSLILGVPDEHGDLQHVGGVGTGFTDPMLDQLAERLAPLRQDTSPFPTPLPRAETRDAIWVRPDLVGEVAYTEWTGDGHLRHPSWRGLRPDKDPRQVHRE